MLSLDILLREMGVEIENVGIEKDGENEQCVKAILESVKEKSVCPECGEESAKPINENSSKFTNNNNNNSNSNINTTSKKILL